MTKRALPLLALGAALPACRVLSQIKPAWTLESPEVSLRGRFEILDAAITALAIDASGRFAGVGGYDGSLLVFDFEKERRVGSIFRAEGRAGVAGIECGDGAGEFAALLADGRVVQVRGVGTAPEVEGDAVGPSAGVPSCRIRRGEGVVVELPGEDRPRRFPEPRATAAAVRGNAVALASGTAPGSARLRVHEGLAEAPVFETTLDSPAICVAFHPTRREVAVGGSGWVACFDYEAAKDLQRHETPGETRVAYDPRGRFLYALHGETLTVFAADGSSALADLSAHRSVSHAIAASGDGATLVTGGARGAIRVWSVRDAERALR